MYTVNEKTFSKYSLAVKYANENGLNVTLEDGRVVWTPAPKVSKKQILRYNEQKNAHDAYTKSVK